MTHVNELVMERPEGVAPDNDSGPIKSILFHVHNDDGLEARLQWALSLARACSAHLQLLYLVPLEAYTVVDAYGTFVSGQIVEALTEEATKLRARIETRLAKEAVSWSYDERTSAAINELLREASLSDLVVIGRQSLHREFSCSGPSLLGDLVCRARTPLCVPGEGNKVFDPFGKAVIAWNGSLEAASAVRQSVGLLKMATKVRVVSYSERKASALSDSRLLEYLSRHGISAIFDTQPCLEDVVDDLVEDARAYAAEYIVMGAYSHSRAGEWLFGGVTRELLRECPVSVVMGH